MFLDKTRQKVLIWLRAFKIWQKTGNGIWVNTRPEREQKRSGFFHGAFDSIPFLNDDAKRTFVHLLLRPGYMMRDYISGKHEIYMAPFAALIIFYSFFAALSPVMHPQQKENFEFVSGMSDGFNVELEFGNDDETGSDSTSLAFRAGKLAATWYNLLHLDQNFQLIDTEWKARLAGLESALRNQGVSVFIGDFLLLWFVMFIGLRRKHGIRLAAAAAVAGYALCQICFFKIFVMLLTLGRDIEVGLLLTIIVITIDYHQLLGVSYKRSLWLSVKTELLYGLFMVLCVVIGGVGAYFLVD
jgi:hypothetical protein